MTNKQRITQTRRPLLFITSPGVSSPIKYPHHWFMILLVEKSVTNQSCVHVAQRCRPAGWRHRCSALCWHVWHVTPADSDLRDDNDGRDINEERCSRGLYFGQRCPLQGVKKSRSLCRGGGGALGSHRCPDGTAVGAGVRACCPVRRDCSLTNPTSAVMSKTSRHSRRHGGGAAPGPGCWAVTRYSQGVTLVTSFTPGVTDNPGTRGGGSLITGPRPCLDCNDFCPPCGYGVRGQKCRGTQLEFCSAENILPDIL